MIVDILFGLTMLWSLYFGYVNGPVKVFLYIISLIVAIVVTMLFTPTVAQLLKETFVTEWAYIPFLAVAGTFGTIFLLMRLVSNLALNVAQSSYVNMGVQSIGSIVLMAQYAFIFSVLMNFLTVVHRSPSEDQRKQAQAIEFGIDELEDYFPNAMVLPEPRPILDSTQLRKESAFYPYIVSIPAYGTAFLNFIGPFVQEFIAYINKNIDNLNKQTRKPRFTPSQNKVTPVLKDQELDFNIDFDYDNAPSND